MRAFSLRTSVGEEQSTVQHQPWKWQEREAGAERRGVGGGGHRVGEGDLGHQGGDEGGDDDEEVKQGGR